PLHRIPASPKCSERAAWVSPAASYSDSQTVSVEQVGANTACLSAEYSDGIGGALFVGVESIMMSKVIAACGKTVRRFHNNMGGSAASAGGQVMVLVC